MKHTNTSKLRITSCALFESIERGSAEQLKAFMREAEFKYKKGMESLVYNPGISLMEFLNADVIRGIMRIQVFSSFSKHIRNISNMKSFFR
jgi:phytoene desaturase